jgi:hypothetical protein
MVIDNILLEPKKIISYYIRYHFYIYINTKTKLFPVFLYINIIRIKKYLLETSEFHNLPQSLFIRYQNFNKILAPKW